MFLVQVSPVFTGLSLEGYLSSLYVSQNSAREYACRFWRELLWRRCSIRGSRRIRAVSLPSVAGVHGFPSGAIPRLAPRSLSHH